MLTDWYSFRHKIGGSSPPEPPPQCLAITGNLFRIWRDRSGVLVTLTIVVMDSTPPLRSVNLFSILKNALEDSFESRCFADLVERLDASEQNESKVPFFECNLQPFESMFLFIQHSMG